MKRIALITGASKGLGHALTVAAAEAMPEIEEFWLLSRSMVVSDELSAACGGKILRSICLDLCDPASFGALREQLSEGQVTVRLLVNNAGCGFLNNVDESPAYQLANMVNLNVLAMTLVTNLVLPYMEQGSHIINISSIASFCPNPRMTVYSATKAYVSAFSRGIGEELKQRGITVTAVCPGPMDTQFIVSGGIKGQSKTFDVLPYCDPEAVARGAVRAALHGRAVYTPRLFFKFYRVLAKILPQAWMIKLTKT